MGKNTKCLFDEQKQTPEGMVSVSQIQSFMSCPKKWEYGYVENLTPWIERPYLMVGRLCHKGMQVAMQEYYEHSHEDGWNVENAYTRGMEAINSEWNQWMEDNPYLEEEYTDLTQTLQDALKVFYQAIREFGIDKYEVVELYKHGEPIPALELHFVVPCAGSKGLHGYIDAILKDKDTGQIWCVDYKFRKTLSPDEEEATNIQNAVYCHACRKMGVNVTGTLTWQHVNTPAVDPKILKDGSVSRAKIKTTWEQFCAFCERAGKDPTPYEDEMREKLADIEWYRGTYEYRNDDTIKNIWRTVVVPASYTIKSAYTKARTGKNQRNLYPWNCKMCQFKDLCQAELRGHDADFLREALFTTRRGR